MTFKKIYILLDQFKENTNYISYVKTKIELSWLKLRTENWKTVIQGKRPSPALLTVISCSVYLSLMRTVWLIYIVEFGTLDFFHDLKVVFKNIAHWL